VQENERSCNRQQFPSPAVPHVSGRGSLAVGGRLAKTFDQRVARLNAAFAAMADMIERIQRDAETGTEEDSALNEEAVGVLRELAAATRDSRALVAGDVLPTGLPKPTALECISTHSDAQLKAKRSIPFEVRGDAEKSQNHRANPRNRPESESGEAGIRTLGTLAGTLVFETSTGSVQVVRCQRLRARCHSW
jgi:hypothetical protein